MATLPIEVLLDIPEFIDDPKDLLVFALTSRIFYSAIVPKHIDYRRISCCKISEKVWKHLSESPYTRRVRYLNIMDNCYHPRTIPRVLLCDDHDVAVDRHTVDRYIGRMKFNLDAFVQALSKMINLKVLKFSIDGQLSVKTICTISRALEDAGCQLEELETRFQLRSIIRQHTKRNGAIIKGSQDCLLFCKRWLSLKKCIITSINGNGWALRDTDNDTGIQMLLNAPNLTHMYTTFVSSSLLSGWWPNLEHLTIYSNDRLQRDQMETEYIIHLQAFFTRHSKLITLSTQNLIIPGWTIESDDFLPNLTSLGLVFPSIVDPDINLGRIITSNMAACLTYLDMSDIMLSFLKKHKTVLLGVDSCCYLKAEPEKLSIQDFTKIIPNITKLYMVFEHRRVLTEQTLNIRFGWWDGSAHMQLTMNERLELSTILLIGFKHLKMLFGPFDDMDITSSNYSLPRVLYNSHSLLYTRVLCGDNTTGQLLRLIRDDDAKTMTYEYECDHPPECDIESWSGFYERTL